MNDGRMRARVARWGLRVQCLLCGVEIRHRPESDGRLRDRPCLSCGQYALRSVAWLKKYPHRANKLLSEHTAGEQPFGKPQPSLFADNLTEGVAIDVNRR